MGCLLGGRRGAARLGSAGLAQPLPRLVAQAFGNCRLSKGLTPAALEAQGAERLTTMPQRLLCPVLSLKFGASHSRVQPGIFLPL